MHPKADAFQKQANEYASRLYGVGYLLTQDDVVDAMRADETPEYAAERKAAEMNLSPKHPQKGI